MIYTKTIPPIYKLSTAKVNIFFDIYKFFLKKTERTFENIVLPLPRIWYNYCINYLEQL